MQIHELPTGNIEDGNKLPFDTGTNTYATSFTALANAVVNKTFSALTTTAKTLPGAINEINNKLILTSQTKTLTSGYCTIDWPDGTSVNTHIPIIIPLYTGTTFRFWLCSLQPTASTIYMYVRTPAGEVPADNTTVSFRAVFVK